MNEKRTPVMTSIGLQENVCTLLSYLLFIPAIVFLVIEKENKYVKFHSAQVIGMGILFAAIQLALGIVYSILTLIPFIGWTIAAVLSIVTWILNLIWIAFAIYGAVKTYNMEPFEMPFLAQFIKSKFNLEQY